MTLPSVLFNCYFYFRGLSSISDYAISFFEMLFIFSGTLQHQWLCHQFCWNAIYIFRDSPASVTLPSVLFNCYFYFRGLSSISDYAISFVEMLFIFSGTPQHQWLCHQFCLIVIFIFGDSLASVTMPSVLLKCYLYFQGLPSISDFAISFV